MASLSNPYEVIDLDFADKTFYGFKIDKDTGQLTVEIVNTSKEGVVELPANDVLKDNQYRTWVWTKNTIQFDWDNTRKTHLLMEIL